MRCFSCALHFVCLGVHTLGDERPESHRPGLRPVFDRRAGCVHLHRSRPLRRECLSRCVYAPFNKTAARHGGVVGSVSVYNLTVADDHTFFVGTTGGRTWVHNSCDLTGFRRTHILNRHMSGAGKSEFPTSWNGDDITIAISDVATAPASTRGIGPYNSPFATGTRNGVDIRVDFYPSGHPTYDGMISTGYPTNMPMNP